jgi:TetR/AcrR family transcriptional regulator
MKSPPPDLARRLLDASDAILGGDPAPRLEDVARLVGASRASLYYYFAGRDDLLSFLLTAHAREGAERARARADESDPPPARLRAMIEAYAEFLGAHPGTCAGLLAAAGSGQRMGEVLAVNDTWVAAPLRAVVTEGAARGLLSGDPGDPAGVGDAVNAALGALLLGVLGRASAGGDPTAAGFRRNLVDQIMRGFLPAPPSSS